MAFICTHQMLYTRKMMHSTVGQIRGWRRRREGGTKQGDCRGEPRGCCGWEGWAQAGAQTVGWACRLWDGMLQRWEAQTSIFAFLKVFRKAAGQGHVVPPHSCPRGPCIPPGGLPCLQQLCQPCPQPALPAACTLNPQAAGAAWGLGAAQVPTMQPGLVHPMH